MTKTLAELNGEGYQLITDSQELDEICQHSGVRKYREDINGAVVLVGDGEYLEVYLTESNRPFDITATYERAKFYRDVPRRSYIWARRRMDILKGRRYKMCASLPFRAREFGYDGHGFSVASLARLKRVARDYADHVDIWA
jgi:hypothetical protein